MQIHQLKSDSRKKKKTVGRGGKRGKTSGRGMKGQKARAGHKLRPESRDVIKRIPKRRGYGKNRARTVNSKVKKFVSVNVSVLNEVFKNGDVVNPTNLVNKGVIKKMKGFIPTVKILGNGDLDKKLTVSGCLFSESARKKIEGAVGKTE